MIQAKACDQARQYGVDVQDEKDFRENVRKWMVSHLSVYVTTKLDRSQPLLDVLEDMAPYTNFPCLKISTEAARIRIIFCESSKAKDKQEELHNFIMQLIAVYLELKKLPVPAVLSSKELKKLWPPK